MIVPRSIKLKLIAHLKLIKSKSINDKPALTWSQLYSSCFCGDSVRKKTRKNQKKKKQKTNTTTTAGEWTSNYIGIRRRKTVMTHTMATHTHTSQSNRPICSNCSIYSANTTVSHDFYDGFCVALDLALILALGPLSLLGSHAARAGPLRYCSPLPPGGLIQFPLVAQSTLC